MYGKNLGLAFQLVDDMLDYTVSEAELGKPAGADLELGLATAPLLFAWKNNKELGKFSGEKVLPGGGCCEGECEDYNGTYNEVTNKYLGKGSSPPKRWTGADTCSGRRICQQGHCIHWRIPRIRS